MTEHKPNLFDEIERLQRANKRNPPTTAVRRKTRKLAAAVVKTPRPAKRPLLHPIPGTTRTPERNPVIPKVPGTRDRPLKPVPEIIKKRFPHPRDFS